MSGMDSYSASVRQVFLSRRRFFPAFSLYISSVSKSVLGLTPSEIPFKFSIPVQNPSSSPFPCTSAAQLGSADISAVQLQALLVKQSAALEIAEF